jgi:hypothetical protein
MLIHIFLMCFLDSAEVEAEDAVVEEAEEGKKT